MKEISDILKAYNEAHQLGKKTALATVVKVEGSSYRQPGARMLVTEDGQLTGAISGGCLEGDALKKALLAIYQQQNKLVTYDTSNEDDVEFGVQLGCNGIVLILFEPIDHEIKNNPIQLLHRVVEERKDAVVATLFSLEHQSHLGTCLFYRDKIIAAANAPLDILSNDVSEALQNKKSVVKSYLNNDQRTEALLEYICPPIAIVIAGAGNDAKPLVAMASILGWHITIADGRATHATQQRFPQANRILLAKPEDVLVQLDIDAKTVFVLMTHNYNYDLALLKLLLRQDCVYIGTLGPKTKLERMINEMEQEGITVSETQRTILHGPVGVDIGAETSEEIAVSIVAEIKKVMEGRTGASLKEKPTRIHSHDLA